MQDLAIVVKTTNPERKILLDVGLDQSVWFHMTVAGGTAYAGFTIEQAKELVVGINNIIKELES
jgi:hypothetical protein